MIVNIWLLPLAVLLLWFPRQWLRFGKKLNLARPHRRRSEKEVRDAEDISLRLRDEFRKVRNWVDLVRAAVGSIGLCVVCFNIAPDAPKNTPVTIFLIQTAVLVVAVLIQTVRVQPRLTLVAPVFFVLGLSFGLVGWPAALLACVAIWALNLVLPSAGYFLFFFAGLEVSFGLLLGWEGRPSIISAAVLALIPILLSAVTNRRLVQLNRKTRIVRA
ncbi:MAG: hypothetical protein JF599_13235 [Verrucomicrobia bacterium]|nr:hypothetical protein [Verrucomicrobiota bacterium]